SGFRLQASLKYATEYFTAANINHDTLKNAIKYTKPNRLLGRHSGLEKISCHYIDNQSIIKAYHELRQTNKDIIEELFCFDDKSLDIDAFEVQKPFITFILGKDRFISKDCIDIVSIDHSKHENDSSITLEESESKLIAYIAAKRYKQLIHLFTNMMTSSSDLETKMNDMRQIFFPLREDSSEAFNITLTPETIFKNVKFNTMSMEAQSLKRRYPKTL
ncbi:MAG: hypothetical protein KAG53_10860, partial [Endozoicomonadaceae bacterium]|nr:hypothetical protein [Endozoicomonadaceae bacterium]